MFYFISSVADLCQKITDSVIMGKKISCFASSADPVRSWVFLLNPNHFGLKVQFQYCIHSIVVFLRLTFYLIHILLGPAVQSIVS